MFIKKSDDLVRGYKNVLNAINIEDNERLYANIQ